MNIKHAALSILAAVVTLASNSVMAGFNDPIVFTQSGQVSITLDGTGGGLDHVLELASATGPVGASPIFYLSSDVSSVLGQAVSPLGSTVALGSVTAGSEWVFRLTNIQSARLNGAGNEGNIDGQVFTGSSSTLNAQPTQYYSLVEYLSPTSIRVTVEDLFPIDPASLPTEADFKGGADVSFTLNLSPVPEADSSLMALAGLGVLGAAMARRRQG